MNRSISSVVRVFGCGCCEIVVRDYVGDLRARSTARQMDEPLVLPLSFASLESSVLPCFAAVLPHPIDVCGVFRYASFDLAPRCDVHLR